jgi:hypothetical protein
MRKRILLKLLLGSLMLNVCFANIDEWQAVSDDELETQRGGFVTECGLDISLGIEKTVVVDGVLQSISVLNIPSLTSITADSLEGLNISQKINGLGEDGLLVFTDGFDTLIQNSLDGRTIQANTVINAHIGDMNLYRESNLGRIINDPLFH